MTNPLGDASKNKNKNARRVELTAQTVAGGVGSVYGAAKLRDAYKDDKPENPAKFVRGIKRAAVVAHRAGVPDAKIVRAAKTVNHGHPGLRPLLALAGAGTVATGAHRYQQLSHFAAERRKQAGAAADKTKALVKAAERHAPSTITQQLRVPVYMPKHAPKKYVGARRAVNRLDTIKTQALFHAPRAARMVEEATELFKSVERVAPPGILDAPTRGTTMTTDAFGISKAGAHRMPKPMGPQTAAAARGARAGMAVRRVGVKGALAGAATAAAGASAYKIHQGRSDFGKSYDAFGIEVIEKASATGKDGDKRNTKYAGAAYGGMAAGGVVGRQVATRTAGTSVKDVRDLSRVSGEMHAPEMIHRYMGAMEGATDKGAGHALKTGVKAGRQLGRDAVGIVRNVPGGARMIRGGKVGAATGAATGVAAYAARRHNMKKSYDAFGVEVLSKDDSTPAVKPNAKPSAGRVAAGTAFGGYHSVAAAKKGKKLGAVGSSVGHSLGGAALGATALGAVSHGKLAPVGATLGGYAGNARAVYSNSAKGRYKPESNS